MEARAIWRKVGPEVMLPDAAWPRAAGQGTVGPGSAGPGGAVLGTAGSRAAEPEAAERTSTRQVGERHKQAEPGCYCPWCMEVCELYKRMKRGINVFPWCLSAP